jgi:hypothetical protein
MNRREERQLFKEVHENNIMLHQICDVINVHLARFHQENEDDFNRNVLANLISSGINFDKLGRR